MPVDQVKPPLPGLGVHGGPDGSREARPDQVDLLEHVQEQGELEGRLIGPLRGLVPHRLEVVQHVLLVGSEHGVARRQLHEVVGHRPRGVDVRRRGADQARAPQVVRVVVPPLREDGSQPPCHDVEHVAPRRHQLVHVDDLDGVVEPELLDHLLDALAIPDGLVLGDAEHAAVDEPVRDDHEPGAGRVHQPQRVTDLVELAQAQHLGHVG